MPIRFFADFRIYKSSDYLLLGYSWDLPGNKLVPADYDGDGRADTIVFRSGAWYVINSTSGITTA